MRVLTPLVCLLLVLVAAASIVHRAKSTGAQHQAHAAAPVLQAHQHHRIAKSINPKIHAAATANTHSKRGVEEDDGSLLAKALFEDVKVEKKAAAQPSHQKLVHSKKLLRDLEKEDVEVELNKVLAAEKDLEAVKEGLTSLTSELKGIETAIRAAEETKVGASKVVVEESSIPASSAEKDTVTPVSSESESKALDAVLADADDVNVVADNKIATTNEESNKVVVPVTKAEDSTSNSSDEIPTASAEDIVDASENNAAENESENVSASAESGDEQQQQLESSTPASADSTENAVDEDQVQEGDSSASFLEISKGDAGEESLVEQLTRSRMNMHINKRLAAVRLAESAADKKDESDSDKKVTDDSAIVITRAGKHVPVDGTGYFKDITKPYVNEVANVTAGENTTDTDVVCVCKRSGAPRGEDRVRCKKHAKPSPSPQPSPVPVVVPVGIRQCATGRWQNGTADAGTTDTICIYFPSKIDIPTPTPIPTPPADEPEYPPECYDERNEFVAPGIDKRPYDVMLLQEGFETCGC